ncbi:MAG: OmpA family protein [Bacteroidota bacterium]
MKILVIIGFFLWTIGASIYWVCVVREGCSPKSASRSQSYSPAHLDPTPLKVWNKGNLLAESRDSFRFGLSDSSAVIGSEVFTLLDSVTRFLYTSPHIDIEITGYEVEGEQNLSSFSTLGLARASHVSQLLQQQGIDRDRIQLSFVTGPKDSLVGISDSLNGAIQFRLLHSPTELSSSSELADSSLFNSETWRYMLLEPRILYFSDQSQKLLLDKEERRFISQCIQYMKLNPEKKLLLTGFSDDQSASVINVQWGLERAYKAKKYFQEFGLPGNRIDVLSLGAADPIASNDTEEGRSQNRRVELSIR